MIRSGILVAVIIMFPLVAPVACTSPEQATDTLLSQNYSEVQITGYAYFECGSDDFFATAFEAKSPSGKAVRGAVCSGLLKGNTVRLD